MNNEAAGQDRTQAGSCQSRIDITCGTYIHSGSRYRLRHRHHQKPTTSMTMTVIAIMLKNEEMK